MQNSQKVKIAVVILNWNGKNYLQKFLPTVIAHTQTPDAQIYIADNGSTDDSRAFLRKNFPDIGLILLDKNYGFAGGYNRALQQINAEFYVILNSDIELTDNYLEPIISSMERDETVAAAMPKIRSYTRKEYFEYAGAAGGFIDRLGYPFCRGRILSELEKDTGQYDDESEIFWATGACLYVRADLFHQLGGFDADFFAHMEEIDLCWRLKNNGYKIMYYPQVTVYHVGGGTLPNNSPHKLFLNFRNNLLLLYKNLPRQRLYPILLLRMILDGMSAMMFLFSGSFSFFLATLKAHFAFYKLILKFREKRNALKKYHRRTRHKQIYTKSIIWDFFIKRKRSFKDLDF